MFVVECLFYLTGSTEDHLLKGIKVKLDTSMNSDQCCSYLLTILKNSGVNVEGKQLLIYLPGGIPFIGGTLNEIFSNNDIEAKKDIYGIFTLPIPSTLLNKTCLQICNVSDSDHQILISPHCNSTEKGLSDVACLLGYLNHDGIKSNLFLKKCAFVIHFAPFIVTLYRIIENSILYGRDIVTFCSTLFTFTRSKLQLTIPDDKVFEYALRICNLIIKDIDYNKKPHEDLRIRLINVNEDQPSTKFLSNLKLGPQCYIYQDSTTYFNDYLADQLFDNFESIENANLIGQPFTPIMPLSMRFSIGSSIVQGKNHQYLYLMRSINKRVSSQKTVDIIDPLTGLIESKDIELFAKEQENMNIDYMNSYYEIIMINLDESKSMLNDLNDNVVTPQSDKVQRITLATQYLTSFINRIYGYSIQSLLGFVSFNDKITLRCPFGPVFAEFEDKALNDVRPKGKSKLLDSLLYSCNEIVKFNKEKNMRILSRILIITDGVDYGSEAKVEDVIKELINNRICVDSIIINDSKNDIENCKLLCTISHITGGLSFKPSTISEGLSYVENNGFLDLYDRRNIAQPLIPNKRRTSPLLIKPNQITIEFVNEIQAHAHFDNHCQNREMYQATYRTRLTTPRYIYYHNIGIQAPNPRHRRILKELHFAAQYNDPKSGYFDADMKIYTFQANSDRWKVFIKGLENTPYENKWWYIYVTFPELYPTQPPVFRFVSIPYHINVSEDGRICHNIIEKGYFPAKHVVDIIQEFKELFLLPNLETPVRIDAYLKFLADPQEYFKNQKMSAEYNAKDNYIDYIENLYIIDAVKDDCPVEVIDHVPIYMRSQISGKPIKKDKMVLASSGVYYDRDELRELVLSNKNPVCILTGKLLTEKFDDI